MRNSDIQKFVKVFNGLDPVDKLEIADAIVESLHLSDKLIRQNGYDRDLSGAVMITLETYIANERDKEKLKNAKNLLNRFNELPVSNQANIIENLEENFEQALLQEEQYYEFEQSQKKK